MVEEKELPRQNAGSQARTSDSRLGDYLGSILPYLLSGMIALAAVGILLALAGKDPFSGYAILFQASFGSGVSLQLLLLEFIPLFLMALAFTVPLVAGKYNVGNEGQFLAGAMASAVIALALPSLQPAAALTVEVFAAILAGAAWAAIPAFMLYRFRVNEIVSTISMNFIAIYLVLYIATGSLRDPEVGFPQTRQISSAFILPSLPGLTDVNIGILLAIILPLLVYFFTFKTSSGFELRVTGANARAGRIFGVKTDLLSSLSLIAGGGIAGLAGGIQVSGLLHSLQYGMQSNYAALSYIVALIGQGNLVAVVIASVFISALEVGISAMQGALGVPGDLGLIVEALLLLLILIANVYRERVKRWLSQ
ncbi:MAG: hypothetical protein QXV32_06340 [Conexivisphaerales archaeon]